MAQSKRKLRTKNSTSIEKLLSDNEVKQYEAGGYVLKELKDGGENGDDELITYKNNKSKVDGTADWNWSSDVDISSAYNDQIKARLLTGNYGYNPKTGELVKLGKSQQTKVTDKEALDTKKTLKETAGMSSKEYEIFQDNEKEAAKQNAMDDYTSNRKLVSIDKADEWNPSFTIQNESGQDINTQDYAGQQVYMTPAQEADYKKARIDKNIPATTKKMNTAFSVPASFTPVGMAITGLTGATKLATQSAPELIKNPSWSNAGAAGLDLLMASPVVLPAGASQVKNIKSVYNKAGEKVDKIVWPKKAYRVRTESGKKNLDYSAGQKASAKEQELLAKVEKKGEWFTDDIDEVAQYAKGNESRAGIFQGDDMIIDEVKIPFWNKNKNVTTNKDVVALKKEQGFIVDGSAGSIYAQRINPNEYIIPRKSIFYPKKSTTIKAMPEEIANKPAMYTLGDGKTQVDVSNTFRKSHTIMDPPKGHETYLTKPYQYLDEQIEGATGINPKIFEGTDDIANAVTTQETALTKIQQLKKDGLISPTLNEQALIDNPNLLDAAVRDGIKKKLTVNRNVYTGDDFASSAFPEASTEALYTGSHTDIMGNAGTGQRVGLKNMSSGDDALYTFRGKGKINSDYGSHNVEARIPFDYSGSTDEMVTSFNNLKKNRVLAKPNEVVDVPANQIKPGAVIDDVSGEGITAIVGKPGDKVLDPVKVTTDVKLTELNKNYKVLNQEADAFIKTQDVSAVNKKYNTNFKNTEEAQQFLNRRTYNASKELIKYKANPPKNPVLKTTSYSPFLGFEKGGVVRDLSKTQAERYKSNGYILEEY